MKKFVVIYWLITLNIPLAFAEKSAYQKHGDYGRIYVPVGAAIVSMIKSDYEGIGLLALNEGITTGVIEIFKRTVDARRPMGEN